MARRNQNTDENITAQVEGDEVAQVEEQAQADGEAAEAEVERQPNEITIAGKSFTIEPRYSEGHVLTAGEASQFNQTFREAVRNNMARKIKELDSAGTFDQAEAQALVEAYAGSFQFGVRQGGGGRTADPVRREALAIATEAVKNAIRKQGRKVAEYEASAIRSKAEELVASKPQFMELARQRVEQAKGVGEVEVDLAA